MRRADVEALRWVLPRLDEPASVLVFSPAWDAQADGTSEAAVISDVWPRAQVVNCDRGRWDLDRPKPDGVPRCDVGIVCNTFMCSRDPGLWLRNISEAVSTLVIQDLAVCQRTPTAHCSVETGDVARYSVSSCGIIGETDSDREVFDFSKCAFDLLDADEYVDEGTKFVAVLRMHHRGVASSATYSASRSCALSSSLR